VAREYRSLFPWPDRSALLQASPVGSGHRARHTQGTDTVAQFPRLVSLLLIRSPSRLISESVPQRKDCDVNLLLGYSKSCAWSEHESPTPWLNWPRSSSDNLQLHFNVGERYAKSPSASTARRIARWRYEVHPSDMTSSPRFSFARSGNVRLAEKLTAIASLPPA
jgi:hypothetical protein